MIIKVGISSARNLLLKKVLYRVNVLMWNSDRVTKSYFAFD
ncbi:hypothetical protein NIES2104_49890 [Leptolyngbya sp. NIES-2104]|nr:hypothetical protein NIES2104_49890 [Leptolyngbya sp. NIES-2104]